MHITPSFYKTRVRNHYLAATILVVLMSLYCLVFDYKSLVASDKVLTFGIVPQQSSTKLAKKWVPLINLLNKRTGFSIVFSTAPDIPTFEARLAAGEYDLAYMNPYHYTVFHESPGYIAFAKQANKSIKGILVSHVDSQLQTIEDLNGSTIAFPAPAAFAATLLSRSHLDANNIKYTPKFVSSHDSVYRAVAGGFATAGGGIYRTLYSIDDQIQRQLKVIWESKGYTPHAFAYHPRLNSDMVNHIKDALIDMANTLEGKAALNALKIGSIENAQNSDWNDVRGLNIDLLMGKQ